MLALENISKEYNGTPVLKNINITFRDQEFVAILGPSGCGKTTLLNIIATIEKSDMGSIYLGNSNLYLLKNKELDSYRNHYLSYIFQNYNLINHLHVLDNVALSQKLKNQKINKNLIKAHLAKLGLFNTERKNPLKLSGGEQQRVAIARSIISDAKIVLADEPTGALDSKNSQVVMDILSTVAKKKLVIMVTHNEKLARKYATRIIKLKDGKVINDSDRYLYASSFNPVYSKTKLKILTALKLSYNNLKNKKIRTYLTVLAFSIGLLSLTLVLGMSKGFKKEIKAFEKESLHDYPLIISKESINLNNLMVSKEPDYDGTLININQKQAIISNHFDENLFSLINKIDPKLVAGISYYRELPADFKSISYINPNNEYFSLVAGDYPQKSTEILLLLDNNHTIDKHVAKYLNIEVMAATKIIGKTIKVKNTKLTIVGVVQSETNYFSDLNGVLYNNNTFKGEITDIYIFANNYQNKELIKTYFKDYYLSDEAKSVIDLTETLINGITLILVIFSIIALIVAIIMIAIITYISVLERQREIGLLKTFGASKKDIKKIFFAENMIIGFLSSMITLELTFNLSKLINNYVSSKLNLSNIVQIDQQIVVIILGLSLILTYLAGLIPAHLAGKKKIVDILHSQ